MANTTASCQVVYADPSGSVHLRLPIFIDSAGACHVSLSPGCDLCDDEAGRVLSHVCIGSCADSDTQRRACLERCIETALSGGEEGHQVWLKNALQRVRSLRMGSIEEKDALRHAVLEERHHSEPVDPLGVAPLADANKDAEAHTGVLTYSEQRSLLGTH